MSGIKIFFSAESEASRPVPASVPRPSEQRRERSEGSAPLLAGLTASSESMQAMNLLCACFRSPNAAVRCFSSCARDQAEMSFRLDWL